MLDEYVWGQVDRISPEAPVQIVSVNSESTLLGGAGNVVNNIAGLGGQVHVAGVIGSGNNGKLLLDKFKSLGLDCHGIIKEDGRPTIRKTRVIAANQHVLRIDRETHAKISHSTFVILTDFIEKIIPTVDAVLISDYGKGLLTREFLTKLIKCGRAHKKDLMVDPKGIDFSKYNGATLLTPNLKEAALASGIEIIDQTSLDQAGARIIKQVGLEKLLITCGPAGMTLFEIGKPPFRIKASARQIFDVSGAGDTVLALMGLSVAAGLPYHQGAGLANSAGGIVVGKVGAATLSITELETALNTLNYTG